MYEILKKIISKIAKLCNLKSSIVIGRKKKKKCWYELAIFMTNQ